jgi:benzoate transport
MHNDPQDILANTPMTATQVAAIALCILLNALDGFDVLAISFAAPGIATEWGINRAALGLVLSMELIGMAAGSIVLGSMADRLGRRPTILGCLVIMSAGMLAAGLATSVTELSVYRFITGLGIGGMLAAINAMAAEFSNAKHRNMAVMLMAGGYPLGAVVGGAIASNLLQTYDWRIVFYFGATVTFAFIILVWWLLPESISFLLQKRPPKALQKINQVLSYLKHTNIDSLPPKIQSPESGTGQLFSNKFRRTTMVLTAAYFAHIMSFYFILKWIPKIVVDMGFEASQAGSVLVWANVGGVLGSALLGLLSHRFAVRALVMVMLVGAAIMVSVFGGGQDDLKQLASIAAVAGFFTTSAVVGMYALFAQAFPTEIRAGGTGFVIGLGRGGAALGPILAGIMFSMDYGLQPIALIMATGSLVAVAALFFLKPASSN